MASIFFSYRKQGEDKPSSLRLADDFRAALGDEAVFRDEKGLKFGRFEDQLLENIETSKILVVVIGPTWIKRIRDLHNEADWVRREIEIALDRGTVIIPVLIEGVEQSAVSDLPTSLSGLFEFQFITIHARHWRTDVDELVDSIANYLGIEKLGGDVSSKKPRPDISGTWTSTEGEVIQLLQQGDNVQMAAYDLYGQPIGQGSGSISGDQINFTLTRLDIGFGSGQSIISHDGRQISGQVNYNGQRYPFSLVRR